MKVAIIYNIKNTIFNLFIFKRFIIKYNHNGVTIIIPYKENVDFSNLSVRCFVSTNHMKNRIVAHPHWHNAVEVLYMKKGNATQQLGDNILPISEGDWVIIWSNQVHSTYSFECGNCEIVVLQINLDSYLSLLIEPQLRKQLGEIIFFDKINNSTYEVKNIINILKNIIGNIGSKNDGYSIDVAINIYNLCGEVYRYSEFLPIQRVKNINDNDKKIALKIFDYIDNNFTKNITLAQAAKYVGLSITHFSRVFKNVTGL